MSTFVSFLIFLFILFLYIHITAQYKKSEDLEIYEADYLSNYQLQEICDVRQPVLYDFKTIVPEILVGLDLDQIVLLSKKSSIDIHVKDIIDINNGPFDIGGDSVPLPLESAIGLFETDDKSRFFSDKNDEFVQETLEAFYRPMDDYLKPSMVVQTKYDFLFGSMGAYTPLRYHTDYRRFIFVQSGKIQVKMTPWKSRKWLYPDNDYISYEFRSPVDVWNPQNKYLNDMENLKFLEFEVMEGFLLYIPPYWFYSIKYIQGTNSKIPIVLEFTYNSAINVLSNLPHWGMYFLQQHNIKEKTIKTKNIENNDNDISDSDISDNHNNSNNHKICDNENN